MEDYEYSDITCPKCEQNPTHERYCDELSCENGYIDISEEDYQVEGTTYEKCNNCSGKGILHWCPKCGYEFNFKIGDLEVMVESLEQEIEDEES